MALPTKYDLRFDPFLETWSLHDISDESHVVPANTPYYIDLDEVPNEDSPSTVSVYDVTGGVSLTEASIDPSAGEFQVDYKYATGKIRFNAAQAGHTVEVTYKGTGHSIAASTINTIQDWIGKSYTKADDHNHNGSNSAVIADNTVTEGKIGTGAVTEGKIGSSAISQAKLKTATSEVSGGNDCGWETSPIVVNKQFTGGSYCFYPQVKIGGEISTQAITAIIANAYTGSSYVTNIAISRTGCDGNNGKTIHAQVRYVQSSSDVYWIYLMVAKIDYVEVDGSAVKKGSIICGSAALDHPCYGTGKDESEIPHPFLGNKYYDPDKHEIVLIDNDGLSAIKKQERKDLSLLEIIHAEYTVDLDKEIDYQPRTVREIDQYGNIKGINVGKVKVPEWAKVLIDKDEVDLKERQITSLGTGVKHRKLKKI